MLTIVADKKNIDLLEKRINIVEKTDINHIVNVFRLKLEDEIRVIDGEYEYLTKIFEINKKQISLDIISKQIDKYSLNTEIDIALGILKNEKMNISIQKLTEIGINKIIPLKTERVVVKLNEKKEKWDFIVKESLKQCRGVRFTELDSLKELKEIEYKNYDKVLFAYENSSEVKKIQEILTTNDKKILYLIGPEGGFTDQEVEFLRSVGCFEISLGKRILRAETAAIVMGGIIANILG